MAQAPDRRVCVHASYINANKTVAQGRRISKEAAVTDPTMGEIHNAIQHLQLPFTGENKRYSRDTLDFGRLKVQIKGDDGKPLIPSIPTRKALFVELAKLCKLHKGRQGKGGQPAGNPLAQAAALVAAFSGSAPSSGAGASSSGASGSSGGGGGGKKGKKGRK
mmetsp:Transcript_17234/g.56398  ORF Transcript_17234/g.56398 Transcript_17234/m.56398 type:complete len:163 (+) Transcript_17234:3-491(+)